MQAIQGRAVAIPHLGPNELLVIPTAGQPYILSGVTVERVGRTYERR